MSFFQAERSTACFRGCILLGSTGNVADPQGAHEFEARKSAQIVGVPFPEGWVLRFLADDRVLHDSFAEVVNHCCDGKCATEPFVQTEFRHLFPPEGSSTRPTGFIGGSFVIGRTSRDARYSAEPARLGFRLVA